jgi:hypothetical protein
MAKEKRQKDKEKLEGTKGVIRSVKRGRTDNTMTKEKGQRDEENLEGTKEVIRSRK